MIELNQIQRAFLENEMLLNDVNKRLEKMTPKHKDWVSTRCEMLLLMRTKINLKERLKEIK